MKLFKIWLMIAIVLQLVIVSLFFFDAIREEFHQPGTFFFHHGGDQNDYFALARSLLDGKPIRSKYTLGFPLWLIPWMVVVQPAGPTDLIQPVAIFHALILFPISQVILASLCLRITRSRVVAVATVILWTLLPVILYVGMALTGHAALGALWTVHLPWLQMLSDPPATFLTLLSFWLMFKVLDASPAEMAGHRPAPTKLSMIWWPILLGVICGMLLLIRVNGMLSISAIMLALLVARRWHAILISGVVMLLVFSPQLVYNAIYFGSPLTVGYQAVDQLPPDGLFNPVYLINALNGPYLLVGLVGLIALALVFGAGVRTLWRRDHSGAIAISVWSVAYLVFFVCYYYSWSGALTRFLIPVYPALALIATSAAHNIVERRKGDSQPPSFP